MMFGEGNDRPGLSRFLEGLFWLGLFLWTVAPLAGYDFWFYLTQGRQVLEEGKIPWSESYLGSTAAHGLGRYADHAWLGAVVCYLFYLALGPLGLVLLKSLLLTATSAMTYLNCRLAGLSGTWAAAWTALALWAIRGRFEMRTYLISDLALAVLIWLLFRYRDRPDPRWLLIRFALLFVLWSNLHQGCVAGLVVVALWAAGGGAGSWKRGAAALAVATIAVMIRPHGRAFFSMLFDTFGNTPAITGVVEWGAPGPYALMMAVGPFLALLLGLTGLGVWRCWRGLQSPPPLAFLLILAAFTYLGCRSYRSMAELLPVAAPMAAAWFPKLSLSPFQRRLGWLLLLTLLWGSFRPFAARDLTRFGPEYPTALVERLRAEARPGQVLNSFEFGNLMVFEGVPPFIHGMTALYDEGLVLTFLDILGNADKREKAMARYDVDSALLHFPTSVDSHLNFLEYLDARPDWKLLAWDDSGLFYVRGEKSQGLHQVRPWRETMWDDPAAARLELEALAERHPSARVFVALSRLALEQNQIEASESYVRKALAISPHQFQAWSLLGTIAARTGDLEGVLAATEGAVASGPGVPNARLNRAIALTELARRQSWPWSVWSSWQASYQRWKAARAARVEPKAERPEEARNQLSSP